MRLTAWVGETQIKPEPIRIQIDEEAKALMTKLLGATSFITKVESDAELEKASGACQQIKGFLSGIENARVQVKRPFLEAERAIQAVARNAAQPLLDELDRIDRLNKAYLRQKRAAEAAEARKRAEEEARAQAELMRQEAEARKKAEEAEAKALGTQNQAEKNAFLAEAEVERRRIAELELNRELEMELAEMNESEPGPEVKGARTVDDYEMELIDPKAVMLVNPRLLRCELNKELVRALIRTRLAEGKPLPVIPGVKITEKIKIHYRSANTYEALKK
jgi:hypothetical protein